MGRPELTVNRTLGFAGAIAIAIGGLAAGALPQRDPFEHWPVVRELRAFPLLGVAGTYLGLALLCGAWLRLRATLDEQSPGDMIKTLLWWGAPLALTPPMFSRDVYSYLAQGAMVADGLDAYKFGPSSLGGPLAANVPPIWQDTPAPYGPVFLRAAAGVVEVTGDHAVYGVWGLRIVALAGVALVVVCLPGIAERFGVPPQRALWFGALNPLLLLHLVAGVHNDAVMVGLMAAGLYCAAKQRPMLATALIVAAALIKVPAAIALIAVVALAPTKILRIGVAGAGALLSLQLAADLGLGWIGALKTPTTVRNGLSFSTDIAMLVGEAGWPGATQAIRTVALGLGCLIAAWALLRSPNPVAGVGIALAAIVLFGPVVHPWYLLWPIVPIAAGLRRVPPAAVWGCVGLSLFLLPGGAPGYPAAVVAAVIGTVAGLLYLRLRPPVPALVPVA
ncbi:polyprenol phosphomannose-dependent alpha 1,6 mannosyltransferase MptB [Dactylosporangium sp. AC04546]|uniref:polyprenol phosphomannose-dependent alpha 1,6 mannosyltransferase MptB n=1 Tax=Dactylosporangium sp. AC04546 TaxID=2862460 RepID=UPI001EDF8EDA|nr:polyprenol phosphomannose-dependent alpha 1,6 mannosyltransferase MptB [Dactylosporangium sp. AC04546]WVK81689.1 polyprenol phosphomannose-dependent alpha 1,6 mannosyltransferase MptB [Dactylosporangium sp. AC04546]